MIDYIEPDPSTATLIWIPEDDAAAHTRNVKFLLPSGSESAAEDIARARRCSRDMNCNQFKESTNGHQVKKTSVIWG